MIQNELGFIFCLCLIFFSAYPDQKRGKEEEKVSFREEKTWESMQYEACCSEGRLIGVTKGGRGKRAGRNLGAEVGRRRQV